MRSIRLSLVIYFLVLLAVALVVASWLVFHTTQQTLQKKEAEARGLVQEKYEYQCGEVRVDLDDKLRDQALTLASLVQYQLDWALTRHRELYLLGLLSACPSPNGYALAPAWVAQAAGTFANVDRIRREIVAIKLDQNEVLQHLDGRVVEYFQIDTSWGSTYRSHSLGEHSFPLDLKGFSPEQGRQWDFADVWLTPRIKLRRVLLNLRLPLAMAEPSPEETSPAGKGARRPLMIYVRCGRSTADLDEQLAEFTRKRDADLDRLRADTATSLAQLRGRLTVVGVLTFAATVLGSFWLVWLGLRPLRQLSEAVSRISPRDIRLPFTGPYLPVELRPIVDRLTETLELLKRAFAREKQATADISHELRTPLAALLATTELALRKPREPAQYAELLRDCRFSAQQMNQIVERLLTLARLDAGVDSLRPQKVDVAALAAQCAAVVRPLAEARGLTLTVRAAPGGGDTQLLTDPDKLREVVNNLLHNAIQYNRPGGSVELTVARDNGHVAVGVRDTGVGIAPEVRGHIFERFYRADPSRTSDGLNAGLGLAIVKEYVGVLGGTIEVDSEVGRGSAFRVLLPTAAN